MPETDLSARPLRLAEPRFGQDAAEAVAEVLRTGQLTQGPRVAAFEDAIAAYCGVAHAVATTSATTALHLTLAALDIGPGDEVVVPDFTWPATGNVVLQRGATVRLADVDARTYNLDPRALEAALNERTRLVIAVDLFGLAADYTRIEGILAARGVTLLCDAACSLGAEERGRRCGAIGLAGCFSFHPRKLLTTGEGGMVTTRDSQLAQRMRRLRNHGGERAGWRSSFVEPGFNYRMSDLQAALGLVQMPSHDAVIDRRRTLAAQLTAELVDIEGIEPPHEPEGLRHAYQAYVALLAEDIDQSAVIDRLRNGGVEATIGTYAMHAEPAYREACGTTPGDLPVSWAATNRTLALPLHQGLDGGDVRRLADAVAQTIARS